MSKCLVWFVGVFSQVDLYNQDISTAVLNTNLIKKIVSTYDDVYCMICVKDQSEVEKFSLLASSNEDLKKCKLLFRHYGPLKDVLLSKEFNDLFGDTLMYYIDSNTGRLGNMRDVFPHVKCIHVSKYLD